MSTPRGMAGMITPNPPVNTGSGPDVIRIGPLDPPGFRDGAGWTKTDAMTDGAHGWDPIDDAEGANGDGWGQV